MTTYGYARVSTRVQNEQRQINAMKDYCNLDDDNIIIEKASGKNFIDRTEYNNLRDKLRSGDLLIIASLDRLGRNMRETASEWEYLTGKGVDILVLDMKEVLDTRKNKDGLTAELINKLVVTILSYVGQKEREDIKERQRQGIDNALRHGTKAGKKNYGRPKVEEVPNNFKKLYNSKKYKAVEIQKICGISKTTYYRYVEKLN